MKFKEIKEHWIRDDCLPDLSIDEIDKALEELEEEYKNLADQSAGNQLFYDDLDFWLRDARAILLQE
jgi:hypothetical protein